MSQYGNKYIVHHPNITVFGGNQIKELQQYILTQRTKINDLENTTLTLKRENSRIKNEISILKESVGILKAIIEKKTEEEKALKLKLSDCEEGLYHAVAHKHIINESRIQNQEKVNELRKIIEKQTQEERNRKMELTRLQGDLSILQQQLRAQTYDSHGNGHHSFADDETGSPGS
jgi:chromosome segregation ATPase